MARRRPGRTVVKNKRSVPKQYKRKSYTFAEKYAIISHFEASSLESTVARFYPEVAQSQHHAISKRVSKWMKDSKLIAFMASNVRTATLTRVRNCGVALVLSKSIELEIVRWINDLRGDGVPVSSKMLELKAVEMAENGGVPVGLFVASPSWRLRFLRTYKLSFRARNRSSQSSPDADDVLGRAFAVEVLAWMSLHRATRVYNADQTAVFFEMLPKKTISTRGARTVWIKCGKKEKQRATAMLLADSDGNKYEIFLIFKTDGSKIPEVQALNELEQHGFGKTMWREIKDIQDAYGVQVYGNKTAWWNAKITVAWMDYFFGDRTESSEPVLLLLDSFSGHWTDEVKEEAARRKVFVKQIPPGLTWRSQPADVAWIKPIKDGLRSK